MCVGGCSETTQEGVYIPPPGPGGLLVPLVLGMFQADKKAPAFQALEQHVKIKGAAQGRSEHRAEGP